MCSERLYTAAALVCSILLTVSCAMHRKTVAVREGKVGVDMGIPSVPSKAEDEVEVTVSAVNNGEPIIMNAVRDELTGEMVATDVIRASKVVARFRNVAERGGKLRLEFDIVVPKDMMATRWRLKFIPVLKYLGDSTALEPVFVTGEKYRDEQMRGYRRYQAFIESIIMDSTAFMRQGPLEIFIRRHFPAVWKMRADTSFVSDRVAESIFGVTVEEVKEHYKRHLMWERNEKRKGNTLAMYRKFVKDPIVTNGVKLDTVVGTSSGDLTYRYVYDMGFRRGMKKVEVALDGSMYEDGRLVCALKSPDDVVFYVSTLSALADRSLRFVEGTGKVDSLYMRGVEAIEQTDYKTAVTILRPYKDYNSALALLLSGYEHAAIACLDALETMTPKACYLMAMLLSKNGMTGIARDYFKAGVEGDPSLVHRANLDPEMYDVIKDGQFL